jgi:hypothetical protein
LFASARLVVHLRPFHIFEVACSHSRISAGLAFQPVTGRNQSPRLYDVSNSSVQSWFRARLGPTKAPSAVSTGNLISTGSSDRTS